MTSGELDRVLADRLAVQRLAATPLDDPADVVSLLTCVQAQDAPLARFSLGLRAGADDVGVRAALDEGRIVRTHILRPTWHFVVAADLRWIQALTAPKVESSMAARYRQLGLDPAVTTRAHDLLTASLAGRTLLSRAELRERFAGAGLPSSGEQVAHIVMLAELRALVCSGPLRGATHTYGLVDELIPPQPAVERDDAVRELTRRFFTGHGPAAVTDLTRWTRLTQTEVRSALADLGGVLESREVDGATLWFEPESVAAAGSATDGTGGRAFILPVFDEAYLTYPRHNFPRADGHPLDGRGFAFAESGQGVVVCDRVDAGWWTRREGSRGMVTVTIALAESVTDEQRQLVDRAAHRLADFTGRQLEIAFDRRDPA